MKQQQRRVETVEEFKLRIAAIIRAKPEQIPTPSRPRPEKRAKGPSARYYWQEMLEEHYRYLKKHA